jgi:methylated-DNA-[protein]-cysteine S-methyltransferase
MTTCAGIETTEGSFVAEFSSRGLKRLEFPGTKASRKSIMPPPAPMDARQQRWLQLAASALNDVMAGRKPRALPPMDWEGSTEFQQDVWRALLRIAPGETKTYAAIGKALGKPLAARAVGGACGANPIPVLVPCHRVLAANGRLGGFSGGLGWKRRLLALEGIAAK